jgi:hypothetical protein
LIAAVEALGRNEQVRRAAALIAGIDSVARRKGSNGHHRLKQITRRRGGRKSRGVNAGD